MKSRLTLMCTALITSLFVSAKAADKILQTSEVTGGFVVHLGCGDGRLTAELKKSDAYIVHGLDTDPDKVQEARKHFLTGEFNGTVSAAVFDGGVSPSISHRSLGRSPMAVGTRYGSAVASAGGEESADSAAAGA